jgi:hypothetical protein
VITASELASRLGPTARGVRVLFIGLGEEVYELELPYIKLPSLRAPIMPADWTRTRSPQPAIDANGKAPSSEPTRLTKESGQSDSAEKALAHGGVDLGTGQRQDSAQLLRLVCLVRLDT